MVHAIWVQMFIILPRRVCGTWCINTKWVKSQQEYKPTVFKNKIQRRMFGPKNDETEECWRNFCTNKHIIFTLYLMLLVLSYEDEMSMQEQNMFFGGFLRKREFYKHRHIWKDSIKMGLGAVWCENVPWIQLA